MRTIVLISGVSLIAMASVVGIVGSFAAGVPFIVAGSALLALYDIDIDRRNRR